VVHNLPHNNPTLPRCKFRNLVRLVLGVLDSFASADPCVNCSAGVHRCDVRLVVAFAVCSAKYDIASSRTLSVLPQNVSSQGAAILSLHEGEIPRNSRPISNGFGLFRAIPHGRMRWRN
jgi:hypothetical protein